MSALISPPPSAPPGGFNLGPRRYLDWVNNSVEAFSLPSGPFPSSNSAIPVPAIAGLLGADMGARQPWVRVKRKRSKRSNFNKWGLV